MKAVVWSWLEMLLEEPRRLLYLALVGILSFWVLRGCLPGQGLPPEVMEAIEKTYITCISPDDTPIEPGVARQPECGKVYVELASEGVIPTPDQAAAVTRAICYRLRVESPRWQTMGQTRHEVLWSERSYHKVAVLDHGEWRTFPDEDSLDEQRWLAYGCPGAYASG